MRQSVGSILPPSNGTAGERTFCINQASDDQPAYVFIKTTPMISFSVFKLLFMGMNVGV